MSWWISIHFYLWQNSLRRWWEQPLSLLSKVVVACLLSLLGIFVIFGIKELGAQLDRRLMDRDTLVAVISESVPKEDAAGALLPEGTEGDRWQVLDGEAAVFLQAAAAAEIENGWRVPIVAVESLERQRLVDDFFLSTTRLPAGQLMEFSIQRHRSEAQTVSPSDDVRLLLNGRDALIGGKDRLSAVLVNGFTRTIIFRSSSVEDLQKAHDIVAALAKVEQRKIYIQSNLRILLELKMIRSVQEQALMWMTIGSSAILGLVFGSLAWMEFREERYLMSLIRTFGVGRWMLLVHALIENCLLALGGVVIGIGMVRLSASRLNLSAVNLGWLRNASEIDLGDVDVLLLGAAVGGILACIPVAIGLRKPIGLVLK